MIKLQGIHHHLLLALAKQGFIYEKQLLQHFPSFVIADLMHNEFIAKSKYNSYYNTRAGAAYIRSAMAHFSPRLSTADMVETLQKARAYIVVDIETTGGSAGRGDKIVEIAALKIANGKQINFFHRFVNPMKPIKNAHIHGITNERVKNEPTIDIVIGEFSSFIEDLPIVSHHINFDWYNFLALELFMHGYPIHNQACCTVMLARKYLKSPKYSLNILAETYNIPLLKHHTADADAICANEILQLILKKTSNCLTDAVQQSFEAELSNETGVYVAKQCLQKIRLLNGKHYYDVTYNELAELVTFGLDGFSRMKESQLNDLLCEEDLRIIHCQFSDKKSRNSMKRWYLRGLTLPIAAKKAFFEQNFQLIDRSEKADISYPFILQKLSS